MTSSDPRSPASAAPLLDAEALAEYCRQLESHLCRKNDGHLIRIVGPAFEQVCGWAARGVPLKLAMQGIDRCVERYYAKGPRRRPIRVEFCEADVLDVFDEWRRSVGVSAAAPAGDGEDGAAHRRGGAGSLPSHLERVIARLTALRGGDERADDRGFDVVVESIVRELDAARASARGLRGGARDALVARLGALDASLVQALRARSTAETLARCAAEADDELRPFRGRLTGDAFLEAHVACVARLLREQYRMPTIAFE